MVHKPLQMVAGVVVGVAYWVLLLALPDEGTAWTPWVRTLLSWGGTVVIVIGIIAGVAWLTTTSERLGFVSLVCLVVGPVLAIAGQITVHDLRLEDDVRFAVGVGGLALAALILGVIRFDTIRAAVSLPAAVLVIGVTCWPDAETIVGAETRTTIIQWMGVLLGANGVAEAARQVGQSAAKARGSSTESIGTSGDLT